MKLGVWIIVALVAGAIITHFLLTDPGYVIINFQGYLIEMSVPVLMALVLSLLIGVWLIYRLLRLPRKLGEAAGQLRSKRAGKQFTRGLIAIAEGKLTKGERLLTRGASKAETPLLNYLAAARVAHLQGADDRRDSWLTMAYEETPGAANAVMLTQAELQLANEQYEQALATLRRIEENVPGHIQGTALLGRTYAAVKDWEHLGELLPRLRKQGRIAAGLLDQWEESVQIYRLDQAADDAVRIKKVWAQIAAPMRQNPRLARRYVRLLEQAGAAGDAETALRKAIRQNWNGDLVRVYGLLHGGQKSNQLKTAEGWLKEHGDDPDLLLATARLCMREEFWGKARSYLESALSIRATPETYQTYGELLSRLGEEDRAANAYRTGLGLASGGDTISLPHLGAQTDNPAS